MRWRGFLRRLPFSGFSNAKLLPPPPLLLPLNQKRSYFAESEEDKAKKAAELQIQLQIKKDAEFKEFEEKCRKDEENFKRYAAKRLAEVDGEYESTQQELKEKVGTEVIDGRIIHWPVQERISGPSTFLVPGVKIETYADGVGVLGFIDSRSLLTASTHASHENEDAACEDSTSAREASQPEMNALVYAALVGNVGLKGSFCTNESISGFSGPVRGIFVKGSGVGLINNPEFQEFVRKIEIAEGAEIPLYLYDEQCNFCKIENGKVAKEPTEFEGVISAKTLADNAELLRKFLNLHAERTALQCILHPEWFATRSIVNGYDCGSEVNRELFNLVHKKRLEIEVEYRETFPTNNPSPIRQKEEQDIKESFIAILTH